MSADARRTFLAGLIDDAGLFPPASLPMREAARLHRGHRAGPHSWILGRFLCPASKLGELATVITGGESWRVSVILDGTSSDLTRLRDDLHTAATFAKQVEADAFVDLVEVRLPPEEPGRAVAEISAAVVGAGFPSPVAPFLEVPHDADLDEVLDSIAKTRAGNEGSPGAKLRCGGADEAAAPTPGRIAEFLGGCRSRGIPFKATAGLHHPFRHLRDGRMQHGFVNLLGAAVLARAGGAGIHDLAELISDDDPRDFVLDAGGFRWRDRAVSEAEIAATRRDLFISYGSCSFSEPTDDLAAFGLLPV